MKKAATIIFFLFITIHLFAQTSQPYNISPRDTSHIGYCGTTAQSIYESNRKAQQTLSLPALPGKLLPGQSVLFVPQGSFPPGLVEQCGAFNLYYEDDLFPPAGFADLAQGATRKQTLCEVLQYVQSVIQIPAGITLDLFIDRSFSTALPPPAGQTWLAVGGPFFPSGYGTVPGFYAGHLFTHITTGNDPDVNLYDGHIQIDFTHNWNEDISATYTPCTYDLASVLLHEVMHVMGWFSNVGENPISFLPECRVPGSTSTFSRLDQLFLHHTNSIASGPFTKIVDPVVPQINPAILSVFQPLRNCNIWLYNNRAPFNQPVYSGNFDANGLNNIAPINPGSLLSHLADDYAVFSNRSHYSPGYQPDYVIAPTISEESIHREWTLAELRALDAFGYFFNTSFPSMYSLSGAVNSAVLTNSSPFRNNYSQETGSSVSPFFTPELRPANFVIPVNNNTPTSPNLTQIQIQLNSDISLTDLNGNKISVFPNSLFNISGCGNGGNNHDQIQLINNNEEIIYTPRPGFKGMARFGFYLSDGTERGAFKVYTIDVQSIAPSYLNTITTIGSNLIMNPGYEEGSELRLRLLDENKNGMESRWHKEGDYFYGTNLSDNHPLGYNSNRWTSSGGSMVRNSARNCSQQNGGAFGYYGRWHSDFNIEKLFVPGYPIMPFSNNATTPNNRYVVLSGSVNYSDLLIPAMQCHRYRFEADINVFRTGLPIGASLSIKLQFVDAAYWSPTVNFETTQVITITSNGLDDWQHIEIDLNYCGAPSSIINISTDPNYWPPPVVTPFIDNLSLIEIPALPPISVTASSASSIISCGDCVDLTAQINNPNDIFCPPSYTWSPGSLNGSTVNVCPSNTTEYTVAVSDGCNVATSSVTITVNPCSCSNCDAILSGTINISPLSGKVYCVNTDININGNVNFTNSELKIANTVKIIVKNGSTLTINHSHLYACDEMWQGIVIENGGRLIVNNNSLIEDAEIGVDISNSTVTTNLLQIDNSIFNKNYTNILLQNYVQTANITYPFIIQNTIFTCRNLQTTPNSLLWPTRALLGAPNLSPDPLAPPYINDLTYPVTNLKAPNSTEQSVHGIYLANIGVSQNLTSSAPTYYEIKIGVPGAGSVSTSNFNIFDNLQYGVYGKQANFTCNNNVFQSSLSVIDFHGGGLSKFGIRAEASIGNYRARVIPGPFTNIHTNWFYDCSNSVSLINYFENIINYTDIRFSKAFTNYATQGIQMVTNRYRMVNITFNRLYNIYKGIGLASISGPYNIGGVYTSSFGEYSGQVNITDNTIQPQVTGYPITNQHSVSAINVWTNNSTPLYNVPNTTINVSNNANIKEIEIHGISFHNWEGKNIACRNNTISLKNAFSANPPMAIELVRNISPSTFGNVVAENNISIANLPSTSLSTQNNNYGIYTSMGSNQFISCNNTQNIYNGIEFDGYQVPTSFAYNNLRSHKYGFVLNQFGVIGQQGNTTKPIDDQWTGTWSGNFKTATFNSSSAQNSIMYVRSSGAYNPNGSGFTDGDPNNDLFYNDGSANSTIKYVSSGPLPVNCGIVPLILQSLTPDIGILERLVQRILPIPITAPQATQFISENTLFRTLMADPSLMNNSPILQNFFTESTNNSLYQDFVNIEALMSLGNFTAAMNAVNALSMVDNPAILNYKQYYTICINHATSIGGLSSSDKTALYNLAGRCPFEDGDIVYKARTLYNSLYPFEGVIFSDNCPDGSARYTTGNNENKNGLSFDAIVYPSPSSGEINIAPYGMMEGGIKVQVFDLSGRKLYENNLTITEGRSNFKLQTSSGAYFINIINTDTNEAVIKKLVIQK